MSLSSVVNLSGLDVTATGKVLIETVFQQNVIFLNDLVKIMGAGLPIPLPLIGFQYDPVQRIELLKFSYPKSPFLNREAVANTSIKQTTNFSITANKPITRINSFLLNFATNQAILKVLNDYIKAGGTFTVVTAWEVITNCLCKGVDGVQLDKNDVGGQGFVFHFERANIYEDVAGSLNSFMSSLTSGGVV